MIESFSIQTIISIINTSSTSSSQLTFIFWPDLQNIMRSSLSAVTFVALALLTCDVVLGELHLSPGMTCKCQAVKNDGRCFYLEKPHAAYESIPTGRDGLKCSERECGVRYECCDTGYMYCLVKKVPYALTCTGLMRKHEVCKITRPDSTYLVPYSSMPQNALV
jgi:hypothetical protein